jgi:DNA excision repair protein ERCC-2
MSNKKIKISVRDLVEFVMRSGDIDSDFTGASRAVEGTRIHKKIQKSIGENSEIEASLSLNINYRGFNITVEGRADAIINDDGLITIKEIKTVNSIEYVDDEKFNRIHFAQAKCYAYIYAYQNKLESADVELTYFELKTERMKNIRKSYSFNELESFFYKIIDDYLVWMEFQIKIKDKRDGSIKDLKFPFRMYRQGQRKLAVAVYKTIKEKRKIFVLAPTGTGKTISILFPAVKAMGEGYADKIFYLTSKTTGINSADEAILNMTDKGLKIKAIFITAKDKICVMEKTICKSFYCSRAKNYFDRVNSAVLDMVENEDVMTREVIEKYAGKYDICPFEFSLDASLLCDIIICDCNYAFDPRVYLKRFFDCSQNEYIFLIDEAHNLVDRGREMYSAVLCKSEVLELKRDFKNINASIYKILGKINTSLIKFRKLCDNGFYNQKEKPEEFISLLREYIQTSELWLNENKKNAAYDKTLDFYFKCSALIKISELYDENYTTYVENKDRDAFIKLFCINPSDLLSKASNRAKSIVFFSATLIPMNYYKEMLGGNSEDYSIKLPSPFDRKNLCIVTAYNVSTKYRDRENSKDIICTYIKTVISKKKGNYIAYFPSYRYMDEVYEMFNSKYPGITTACQNPSMNDEEKQNFMGKFLNPDGSTLLGFAVLGGAFGEGIDLKGESLIGAVIIGVGLPQICSERDIIKNYFSSENNGFEYAYVYPGMNRVLQAAGRVIRTEVDKGVVMLVDERFMEKRYKSIFPDEWKGMKKVKSPIEASEIIDNFWKGNQDDQ